MFTQNEYAKQIKEYRAQDKGKAYGKVFVKGGPTIILYVNIELIPFFLSSRYPRFEFTSA